MTALKWYYPAIGAVLVAIAMNASAQTRSFSGLQSPRSIDLVVLDSVATYQSSEFGGRIEEENQSAIELLDRQNRFFDCVLADEESKLLELKPRLNEEQFKDRRDHFAATAEKRRGAQDDKERELRQWYDTERARFQNALSGITAASASREDIDFIIDTSQVFFYDTRFDLTNTFIQSLNDQFGDGKLSPNYQSALMLVRFSDDELNIQQGAPENCQKELSTP